MDTYAFWDSDVLSGTLLVFTNAALVPAIFTLALTGDAVSALLFTNTLVASSHYHLCRSGLFCLFRYEMHKMHDYLSVYISMIWILTKLGVRSLHLHVFTFFFAFLITQFFILGEADSAMLPLVGIALPTLIAFVHSRIKKTQMFHRKNWAIATFVFALTGAVFMFALADCAYGWAHSLWHVFSMLAGWTFIIAIRRKINIVKI